jgi:hypothetical protein
LPASGKLASYFLNPDRAIETPERPHHFQLKLSLELNGGFTGHDESLQRST